MNRYGCTGLTVFCCIIQQIFEESPDSALAPVADARPAGFHKEDPPVREVRFLRNLPDEEIQIELFKLEQQALPSPQSARIE